MQMCAAGCWQRWRERCTSWRSSSARRPPRAQPSRPCARCCRARCGRTPSSPGAHGGRPLSASPSAAVPPCVVQPERGTGRARLSSPLRRAARRIATSIFDVILGWGQRDRKAFAELLAGYPKDRLQVFTRQGQQLHPLARMSTLQLKQRCLDRMTAVQVEASCSAGNQPAAVYPPGFRRVGANIAKPAAAQRQAGRCQQVRACARRRWCTARSSC